MIDYTVIRSDRKTLAIEVTKELNIVVRSPKRVTEKQIKKFVSEREEWIIGALKRQEERALSRKEYSDSEIEALRKIAKAVLPQKVKYFSEIMGVKPISVKINSAKTRYGSCSGKNSINFSLFLMDKDEKAIDYVVVHELAHIKHHNHSKDFYSFVSQFLPDYKERERLLKK